jgi:hypothetical protein
VGWLPCSDVRAYLAEPDHLGVSANLPGKGGATVAEIRSKTDVRAGVSKVVPGVQDRILTVTGTLEAVTAVGFVKLLLGPA